MSLGKLKELIKEEPISIIISHYIPLIRRGATLSAKCPFHPDTNPSMHINDSKGLFRCFACNTGGDAITFVMRYKNVDFIEALQEISNIIGLRFDDYKDRKEHSEKEASALNILKITTQLYRTIAKTSGKVIFDKFLNDRRIKDETAADFSIGLTIDHSPLSHYLNAIINQRERNNAIELAIELNLVKAAETSGQLYDTFQNRVMFPITDLSGHIVGFGGRALFNEQRAKYLNSKESFIFKKSNILYGFQNAKREIRKKDSIVIVEGQMDLLSLYQAGFKNSVAIMGFELSPVMISRIKNLTKNVYLALDSDNASITAMGRLNNQFLKVNILPFYINFSPHKDPDEFLKSEGGLALHDKILSAHRYIDFELDGLIPNQIPEDYDHKLSILNDAFKILSPLKDDLHATERIIALSESIGLKSSAEQILKKYYLYLNKEYSL